MAARRQSLCYAALCALLVLSWQALTVHFNYGDDWSALFYTGAFTSAPPAVVEEDVYRFANSSGFDGQYYHFIAHDPFLRNGTERFVDNPRLRWRRILVPLIAWGTALGQSGYIDSTFLGTILAFVFLGAWWLGMFCRKRGLNAAWGLTFALIPAVLISIDRSTIDVSLAALSIGFIAAADSGPPWLLYLILICAPLARETGLVLNVAYVIYALTRKSRREALIGAASTIPWLVWLAYLYARTTADRSTFASFTPFEGLLRRTLHPVVFQTTTHWLRTAALLEYIGVLGIWVAVALTARLAWKRRWNLAAISCFVFAGIFVVFLSTPEAWATAYGFARTMSPLLIWLGLIAIVERSWINLAPLALTIPRILFQLEPQWHGILHGLKALW